MNRRSVGVIGALLACFVGWSIYAGNRLPSEIREQVRTEQKHLTDLRGRIDSDRKTLTGDVAGDPDLFHYGGFDQTGQAKLADAGAQLGEASRYGATLDELIRRNRRSSSAQVQDLLGRERARETAAEREAGDVMREVQNRKDLKQNYAQVTARMVSRAKTLESADYTALTAKVNKAETDWPARKTVLDTRLNALVDARKQAADWEKSAVALEAKPDYGQALQLQDTLDHAPGPAQAAELTGLTGQLYTSWDEVLEDLDKSDGAYREKLKRIVTTVPAPHETGSTSSSVAWNPVTPDQWNSVKEDLGMTIAHKPLGEFNTEADHTPEPAGFAYMASPEQGRNQYGYWQSSGGHSVWTWLPEYLILRDLLYPHYYQPIPSYDWGHYYEARRYGQTYYGRSESGAPAYGSHGTFTLQHYGNSRYVQSGGFSGSKYGSSGGFSASKYGGGAGTAASPSSAGSRFGASSSSAPHRYGGSSGMRFGSGSRSSGHSFGGRRH